MDRGRFDLGQLRRALESAIDHLERAQRHLGQAPADEIWLSIADAARYAGRSDSTIRRWVRTGRLSSQVHISRRDLDRVR